MKKSSIYLIFQFSLVFFGFDAHAEKVTFTQLSQKVSLGCSGIINHQLQIQKLLEKNIHPDHMPYVLTHGHRTRGVVVLVHGFGESPAGMNVVAERFYKKGYNVVTVLLEGHGTKSVDLDRALVSSEETFITWQKQIFDGILLAQNFGEKVVLGGFSLGAATVAKVASDQAHLIKAVALFAPALRVNRLAQRTVNSYLKKGTEWISENSEKLATGELTLEKNPFLWVSLVPFWKEENDLGLHGYTRLPARAYNFTQTLADKTHPYIKNGLSIPTSIIYSEADVVVDPTAIVEFANNNPEVTLFTLARHTMTQHNQVIRPPSSEKDRLDEVVDWASRIVAPL